MRNIKNVTYYIYTFVAMLILSGYRVIPTMAPFVAPLLFALIYIGYNPYIILVEFFVSGVLVNYSMQSVLILSSQIGFAFLFYLLTVILKNKHKKIFVYVLLFFSNAAFIYFSFTQVKLVILSILSIALSMILLFVYILLIEALKNKGYYAVFSIEEKVAISVFILTLFMGLSAFDLSFNLSKYVAIFLLLCISDIFTEKTIFTFAILSGLGNGIATGSISNIATLAILAITCQVVKKRYVKAIAIVLVDQVVLFALNITVGFSLINLIIMIMIAIFFILIPDKYFATIRENVGHVSSFTLSDFIEQSQRKNTTQKLRYIADTFSEINRQYKNLIVGELDEEKAIEFICNNVYGEVCNSCQKKDECYKDLYVKSGLESFARVGLKKEQINLLDVPLQVASCLKLSELTQKIKDELDDIKKYTSKIKNKNNQNIMLSNQLLQMGEVLKNISENSFDSKLLHTHEKTLIEKLMDFGITVKEVAEIYNNQNFKEIVILIKNEDVAKGKLIEIASKVYNIKLYLSSHELSNDAGWSVVKLSPEPRLKQVVGVALSPRQNNTKSGDNYSIIKVNNERYIFAIADGMGSGVKANKISESTLSLVENFYKAGLPSHLIARCVNNIIVPLSQDNFSALDLLQFNTATSEVDFLKMGASVSILKRKGRSEIIMGQGLPIGVVYDPKQSVINRVVEKNDIIILASDGIVDSFSSIEDFAKYVNNENILNMQLLAESILEEATARSGINDDKTVLAIRFI